jgi:hypothetical protein
MCRPARSTKSTTTYIRRMLTGETQVAERTLSDESRAERLVFSLRRLAALTPRLAVRQAIPSNRLWAKP